MLRKIIGAISVALLGVGMVVATASVASAAPPCPGPFVSGPGCGGATGTGGAPGAVPGTGLPCLNGGGILAAVCAPGAAAPAAAAHVPTVDIANEAEAGLALPAPTVHTSPHPKSFVQVVTYFWINRNQYGTLTNADTVDGQTVTVKATAQSVTWNLGESTMSCNSAGGPGGSCRYQYQRSSASQPSGAYHITATTNWTLTWTCVGACDAANGALPNEAMPSAVLRFPVGEIQTESSP